MSTDFNFAVKYILIPRIFRVKPYIFQHTDFFAGYIINSFILIIFIFLIAVI